jgi:hypothetical protein
MGVAPPSGAALDRISIVMINLDVREHIDLGHRRPRHGCGPSWDLLIATEG